MNQFSDKKLGKIEGKEQYTDTCHQVIEKLRKTLDLPQTLEEAAKESVEEIPVRIHQHYKPVHMAAATLHLETRLSDSCCPRTVKQVATTLKQELGPLTHASRNNNHHYKVRRAAKKLKQDRDLDLDPEMPGEYLPYILDSFQFEDETRDTAWEILEEINGSQELQSKSKIGVAGATAYIAAQQQSSQEITITEIREQVCRNKKTLRDTVKAIQNQLPDEFSGD